MKILLVILCIIFSAGTLFAEDETIRAAGDISTIPVNVLRKIDLPMSYHEGLFKTGDKIWVSNGQRGKIWEIDIQSGRVTKDIISPGDFTEAIVQGPDGVYLTDWDAKSIYRVDLKDDKLVKNYSITLGPDHPAGLVWNGTAFYAILWTNSDKPEFYLVEVGMKGGILQRRKFTDIDEPAHMALDGKTLWVTSWDTNRVYKIDANSWTVLGYFESPVSDPTGIICDDDSLWLTGTYGGLYQLKVGKTGK